MNQIVLLIPDENGNPIHPVVLVPYLPPYWGEGNNFTLYQAWLDEVLLPAVAAAGIDPALVNEWALLGEVET